MSSPPINRLPPMGREAFAAWEAEHSNTRREFGAGGQKYMSMINDVERLLDSTRDGKRKDNATGKLLPTDGELRIRAQSWIRDQYNPDKLREVVQAITTGEHSKELLAKNLRGHLLNPDGTPKLCYEGGCWTWGMETREREHAVAAFQKCKTMAAKVITLLKDEDKSTMALFKQYFGKAEGCLSADDPSFSREVATVEEVAKKLVLIAGHMEERYVLCGPECVDTFKREPDTNAFADSSLENVTYVGNKFFHPHERTRDAPENWKDIEAQYNSAATLLHEASHQAAKTEDVIVNGRRERCYGREVCKWLPGNYSANNADSLALFCQDVMMVAEYGSQVGEKAILALIRANEDLADSSDGEDSMAASAGLGSSGELSNSE